MSQTPPDYEWNWHYVATPLIKVPSAYLAAYKADPVWNGSNNSKTNEFISIEGISASTENSQTSFDGIDNDTDLGDTVIGDVYITVGEDDGYDPTDGSIVLNSTMDGEYVNAVGNMAPGESDLAFRFNGLVVQVPAGKGSVSVNCQTLGSKQIGVKVGNAEPKHYTKDTKGDITVEYDVENDTYVYIYAIEKSTANTSRIRMAAPSTDNCIKIYAIGIVPTSSGINEINYGSDSPITHFYNINGMRVSNPTQPGIYIVRRADGTTSKVLIK
ncbi:MAG: hypothetical protein K2M65_02065 [Muribaculaceae bacterium]|nr:hypothetical protein [Muribaculaceae bacterium]